MLKDNAGKLTETGNYCDDKMCSEWKYYKQGVLEKKVNYLDGTIKGHYEEYYRNGRIKIRGQFGSERRVVKVKVFNPETYEDFIQEMEKDVSFKQGVWDYYNRKGDIIRTVKYN